MKALYAQLQSELQRFHVQEQSIETVFIGGGTPSTVSPELYQPIFDLLKNYLACGIEITSEANPNSATKEWLLGMWKLGVNRISFGVQSFNNDKLKLLNRAHNSEEAKTAIMNAAEIGFENISLDLIYATLYDTKELLEYDLETAFSLPINHLSAYALTIEEGTPFERKPHMSKEILKVTTWLFDAIQAHGFHQYEISNFGKYQSRHNLGYWQHKDYIGLGSGAVGKMDSQRFYPTTIIEEYIANPFNIKIETLSNEDKKIEQIFLGFRSCVGVDEKVFSQNELKRANILVDEKKLDSLKGRFYNLDYLLADEITLFVCA